MNQKKRYYEFVTSEEFHNHQTKDITNKAVWKGFQEQTTAHGIPHVKNARGPIKTVFWILISLVCCALLIYYAYILFNKFISYPFNVTVEVVSESNLDFPAVTVCNHNPIRRSMVLSSDLIELQSLFDMQVPGGGAGNIGNRTSDDTENDGSRDNIFSRTNQRRRPVLRTTSTPTITTEPYDSTTTTTGSSEYGSEGGGFTYSNRASPNGRPVRDSFARFLRIQEVLAEMHVRQRRSLGYNKEDFILDCEYMGGVCSISDFAEHVYDPTYGNCFTFNMGINGTDVVEKSFRPGPKYGLAVTFNINQDEYFGTLAQEAGVRIVVHDQDRMPFPGDEGISIKPGELTYVGMHLLTIERLGNPYGKCEDTDKINAKRNVFSELFGVKYSTTACYKTCYQKNVIARCGCADANLPMRGEAFERARSPCRSQNRRESRCMNAVLDDYQREELGCDCPRGCTESTYSLTTSAAAWPSESYRRPLFNALAAENRGIRTILNSRGNPDKYKDNLLKVVIFFEEFNYELITEKTSYESFALVSDLGGILGLFIGFSVMTIAEFIELGLDIVILNAIKSRICCLRNKTHTSTVDLVSPNKRVGIGDKDELSMEDFEHRDGIASPPPPYPVRAFAKPF